MNPSLESAIEDLDRTTGALLTADAADTVALCHALEERAEAITTVAALLGSAPLSGKEVLKNLSDSLRRGEEATRKALRMKQDAIEEWSRMNQILRALESGRIPAERHIDCSA